MLELICKMKEIKDLHSFKKSESMTMDFDRNHLKMCLSKRTKLIFTLFASLKKLSKFYFLSLKVIQNARLHLPIKQYLGPQFCQSIF